MKNMIKKEYMTPLTESAPMQLSYVLLPRN